MAELNAPAFLLRTDADPSGNVRRFDAQDYSDSRPEMAVSQKSHPAANSQCKN